MWSEDATSGEAGEEEEEEEADIIESSAVGADGDDISWGDDFVCLFDCLLDFFCQVFSLSLSCLFQRLLPLLQRGLDLCQGVLQVGDLVLQLLLLRLVLQLVVLQLFLSQEKTKK